MQSFSVSPDEKNSIADEKELSFSVRLLEREQSVSHPIPFRFLYMHVLNISGDYSNTLDIEGFSLMMKNPSYCYKFYWLEAVVVLISEGVTETTFDAVIDEMIANAWYSVREFHIHLSGFQNGEVRDGVER